MKLSHFQSLLAANADKPFRLMLPNQDSVPQSFHVTEVGHVTKRFIDCGGQVHTTQSCQLQVWLGDDLDHRLRAGKLAGVLSLAIAKEILPAGQDLEVEIEYENPLISQYAVASHAVTEDAVVLRLASKHTDCLAKEICLPMVGCGCGPSCDC